MRMGRRLYEEDSSVESSEDHPLYRTPRLHGGQGPSGEPRHNRREISESSSELVGAAVGNPENRVFASNNSLPWDNVKYIMDLCDSHHMFENTEGIQLRHRCKVCGWGWTERLVQCSVCKMFAHRRCCDVKNKKVPLPCIPATPIADIKRPNLRQCVADLPVDKPKIPALLIKCFHELQKGGRIEDANIYVPLPTSGKDLKAIKKLSRKLRRHTNRRLEDVPTQVVSGCVLKFLLDIRDQLFMADERNRLVALESGLENRDPDIMRRFCETLRGIDKDRLDTIAAVFLHIRNLYVHRRQNGLNTERVHEVFGDYFEQIQSLFQVEPSFWLDCLGIQPC